MTQPFFLHLHNCCQVGSLHLGQCLKLEAHKYQLLSAWRTRKVSGLRCANICCAKRAGGALKPEQYWFMNTHGYWTHPSGGDRPKAPKLKSSPSLVQKSKAPWAATVCRLPKHLLPRRLRRPHGLRTPTRPPHPQTAGPQRRPRTPKLPVCLCRMDPGSCEELPPTTLVVRMCSIPGRRPQAAGLRRAP